MTASTLKQYAIGILSTMGIVGVLAVNLYTGQVFQGDTQPPSITVDGKTIEFPWTDDNSGEDLLIFTDKQTYVDRLHTADVYVAVINRSGTTQDIELMGYFRDSNKHIKDVSVLTEVTQEVDNPIYSEECTSTVATTTEIDEMCIQVRVGTSTEEVILNQWIVLPQTKRDVIEIAKEEGYSRKQVENFIAQNKTVPFNLRKNKVLYYKLLVEFPSNSEDNFYLEAIGSKGAYGHLDPWFNASWTYRIKVTVDNIKVDGSSNHTNFPVYLDLSDLPLAFHTNVKSDGCDIRMVEANEITETAFELVDYDATSDTGEIHFLADSLSYTTDTDFYIYYGNSGASCYAITDTYGAEAVWADYSAVWHMQEDPSGTAPQILDSTANSHDLTSFGTMTSGDLVTGKIGNAIDFDGSNDYFSTPDTASLDPGLGDFTTSGIVNLDDASTRQQMMFKGDTSGDWWLHGNLSNTALEIGYDDASSFQYFRPTVTAILTSQWYHWVGVRDKGSLFFVYEDGVSLGSTATNNGDVQSTQALEIGTTNGEIGSVFLDGRIDELRIRKEVLSTDWNSTEHNNQNSPSTFYSVGSQETDGVAPPSVETQNIYWFH